MRGLLSFKRYQVAVCQISILNKYVTNSPSYIRMGTRSSVYTGVQLPTCLSLNWIVLRFLVNYKIC